VTASIVSASATVDGKLTSDRATVPVVVVDAIAKQFALRRGLRDTLLHPGRRECFSALRDVSFAVQQGEFFGLLGPNGAGKTTLFKTLSTLMLPDAGSASVCGFDVETEAHEVRRLLAAVTTDERSLFWRVSAADNLEFYAALHGLDRREGRRRAQETLEIVGLSETGSKMVGAFSSGMKQRLLIGRALIARPRVLLLDEPTRSLDPLSARTLRQFLRDELVGRQGCTVVLATHNAEEALDLCDRVGVLFKGQLLATGPAAELARQHGDPRYRIEVPKDHVDQLVSSLSRAGLDPIERDATIAGSSEVEVNVHGGTDGAAALLRTLVLDGVRIEAFERVGLSLADLIERVASTRTGEGHDA
jgi:ABC-2 type transport system ATP-binding protein